MQQIEVRSKEKKKGQEGLDSSKARSSKVPAQPAVVRRKAGQPNGRFLICQRVTARKDRASALTGKAPVRKDESR